MRARDAMNAFEKSLSHLDGLDLSDEQKSEYGAAVWEVMQAFVDLSFGLDSTQLSLGLPAPKFAEESAGVVDSKYSLSIAFSDLSNPVNEEDQ